MPWSGRSNCFPKTHTERHGHSRYARPENRTYSHRRSSPPPQSRASRPSSPKPLDTEDYYATLGISRKSDAEEIRRVARQKRINNHPDRLKKLGMSKVIASIEEKAKKIGMAADVLTDVKSKREYNKLLGAFGDIKV